MTADAAASPAVGFARGLAGVVVALLLYMLGAIVSSAIIGIPSALLHVQGSPIINVIGSIAYPILGMWFARRGTDWLISRYSGRGVFVTTFGILLVFATTFTLSMPNDPRLPMVYLQMVVLASATYFFFWRRELEIPSQIATRRERGKMALAGMGSAIPTAIFLVYGLIQFSAIAAEVRAVLHWPRIVSTVVAVFLSYFPVFGSIVGFFGAKDVWGWEWWQAALLYLGLPIFLMIGFAAAGALIGLVRGMTRRAS